MKRLSITLALTLLTMPAAASVRLKDVARIQGVRDNQLVGYGLVVGLNRTGDRQQTFLTTQSLINMLDRLGVTPRDLVAIFHKGRGCTAGGNWN